MFKNHALILSPFCRCVVFLFALLWLIPAFVSTAVAQTPPAPPQPATAQPPTTEPSPAQQEDWRRAMRQGPPSTPGCHAASYPSTQWQEVPCTTPPAIPFRPARGPGPATIGNGTDVSASVTGVISEAIGSFDSASGITGETGIDYNNGLTTANTYTLQLNANTFATSICKGTGCVGWQQFVYSATYGGIFMQYWLISYSGSCPSGWMSSPPSDCYRNSVGNTSVGQNIAVTNASLPTLSLTGQAVSGGNDTFQMAVGSKLYSVTGADSVVGLAQGWQQAEFNIFGDGNSTEATLNGAVTLVVRTSTNNGSTSAPSCYSGGFTGETNNLKFAAAPSNPNPGTLPAIVFTESTAGGASSACASAIGVAGTGGGGGGGKLTDTHDFNGDGYSDIAWRNTDGDVGFWLMNGTQILSAPSLGNVPTSWVIAETGDFNGDGFSDILWRNTNGDVSIWFMNGTLVVSAPEFVNVPTSWTIQSGNAD